MNYLQARHTLDNLGRSVIDAPSENAAASIGQALHVEYVTEKRWLDAGWTFEEFVSRADRADFWISCFDPWIGQELAVAVEAAFEAHMNM